MPSNARAARFDRDQGQILLVRSVYDRAEASVWVGRFVLVWLLIGHARSVFAQPPAASPSVQYEAPDACPARADFVERMRARIIVDGTRVPADISLRVSLVAKGTGTQGTVEIKRGATKTQRSVEGGRCEQVVDALALIAALALREYDAPPADSSAQRGQASPRARKSNKSRSIPADTDASAARAEQPSSPDSSDATATRSERSGRAADQGVAAAEDGLTAAERESAGARRARDPGVAAPGDVTESERAGADPVREGEVAAPAADSGEAFPKKASRSLDGDSAEAARTSSDSDSRPLTARVAVSGVIFSGLAPAMQPGLQLHAALDVRSKAFTLSLQLGGRIARAHNIAAEGGNARLGFIGGVVRLCGSSALGSPWFALSGCAVAEPGVFSADGDNTLNRRTHSRLWLAFGAAADVSVRVATWLNLRAGAELLAPYRRDRVLLAGETLYRIPALGLRLQLGLEVPFG